MDWETLESIFLKPQYTAVAKNDLELKRPDREGLLRFMVEERDFSTERVTSSLDKAFKAASDSQQASLKRWF
jgi:flap endonuclease-1